MPAAARFKTNKYAAWRSKYCKTGRFRNEGNLSQLDESHDNMLSKNTLNICKLWQAIAPGKKYTALYTWSDKDVNHVAYTCMVPKYINYFFF